MGTAGAANAGGDQSLGAARVSLGLLIAINLLNYVDRYVLSAVEPLVREELLPGDPAAKTDNPQNTDQGNGQ